MNFLFCRNFLVLAAATALLDCGSSHGASTDSKSVVYDGQNVVSYCKMYGGMPGPTCSQVDEFWIDDSGNANHTMTCPPFDGSSSTPRVKLWSLEANQLLSIKKSLVEDDLFSLDSNYLCGTSDSPCNGSTDGPSYSISLTVNGEDKSIGILTSNIPETLQNAMLIMCAPPDEPPYQ